MGLPIYGGATTQMDGVQTVIGGNAIITLDADLKDDDIKVSTDRHGHLADEPIYVILGHELIHALHITTGHFSIGQLGNAADIEKHRIEEEENTISRGYPTEADIRSENGLRRRFGNKVVDRRLGAGLPREFQEEPK